MNNSSNTALFQNDFFNDLRAKEFNRLDAENQVYLDFTGGNLYADSQLKKHFEMLQSGVFGNPHSTNPSSQKATHLIEDTRQAVLDFFNASDYYCIFTQNASGALKIVGESYPFNDKSQLVMLADNHNSVNGIREFCLQKKGKTIYVPVQYEDLCINEETLIEALKSRNEGENNLFAFPAQSNVSGVKHNLKWIDFAHQLGYDVLLDAAAFVSTSKLDLSVYQPDFVSVSFYKIFGFPTGLGCLLVNKNKFNKLVKPWFAGGTVTLVSVVNQSKFLANGHERFEDGTLNYLEIPAIKSGLEFIQSIGLDNINKRVSSLIQYVANQLAEIKHSNGSPVVKIFGPSDFQLRGGNIIVNFFDSDSNLIPFELIENKTNAKNISIRSGCFCNPGIDEINNCITNDEISKYFVSRDKGDYYDMIKFLGKMRGATRISVGIATVESDLNRFVDLIKNLIDKKITDL